MGLKSRLRDGYGGSSVSIRRLALSATVQFGVHCHANPELRMLPYDAIPSSHKCPRWIRRLRVYPDISRWIFRFAGSAMLRAGENLMFDSGAIRHWARDGLDW